MNHLGSTAAEASATIRASTGMPCRLAASADVTTSAAAPSLMLEAFAAVTVPSLENAGLSFDILSSCALPGPSSFSTTTGSPLRDGTDTGTISALNFPAFWAWIARSKLRLAKASCSSRVKPYLAAHASPQLPMWTLS